jgi:surface antigen
MNKTASRALFTVVMCGICIQPAIALDLLWLNQSPARHFTDEDWDLAKEAASKALNTAKDGETVSWKSPTSDTHGSFTPLSTSTRQDTTCREVRTTNHARNLDGGSVINFCQQPDGDWALVSNNARK